MDILINILAVIGGLSVFSALIAAAIILFADPRKPRSPHHPEERNDFDQAVQEFWAQLHGVDK